ncbi:MAG: Ada metal-binding domain-containing protein [Capsulimonadaceae bacterium]
MKALIRFAAAVSAAALIAGAAVAQSPNTGAPGAANHGRLGILYHRHTDPPQAGNHASVFDGQIIGNKHTHVYHMPGDKTRLPEPQNRVYFRTEAQAIDAGFRRAKTGAFHGGGKHPHRAHASK